MHNMMILGNKCIHNSATVYLRNMFSMSDNVKNLRKVKKIVIPRVNNTRNGLNTISYVTIV